MRERFRGALRNVRMDKVRMLIVASLISLVCMGLFGCATCGTKPGDKPPDQQKSTPPPK
jgi:hypothetical protein